MRNTKYRDRTVPRCVRAKGYTESLKGMEVASSIPVPARHFTPIATPIKTPDEVFIDFEGSSYRREVMDARD